MKLKFSKYFLVTLLIVSSCAELEEKPYGFLSSENYYTTPENVRGGLFYAYQSLYRPDFFQGEDRLPLRLGFFCGLADHFTSSSSTTTTSTAAVVDLCLGFSTKPDFSWDFTAAPLRLQID